MGGIFHDALYIIFKWPLLFTNEWMRKSAVCVVESHEVRGWASLLLSVSGILWEFWVEAVQGYCGNCCCMWLGCEVKLVVRAEENWGCPSYCEGWDGAVLILWKLGWSGPVVVGAFVDWIFPWSSASVLLSGWCDMCDVIYCESGVVQILVEWAEGMCLF